MKFIGEEASQSSDDDFEENYRITIEKLVGKTQPKDMEEQLFLKTSKSSLEITIILEDLLSRLTDGPPHPMKS
jgi:hypothetical protein